MPTSRLYSLLAALPLAVLAMPIGCAAEADPEETGDTSVDSTADELKSLVIDDDDDGKTFNVTAGQNVVVKLSSNPTTGYKWHVSSTDRTFGYPAKDVYTASKPAAVGSGGVQTLTWKTAGGFPVTGKHTVKLEYQRPWAETAPPAKTSLASPTTAASTQPPVIDPSIAPSSAISIEAPGSSGAEPSTATRSAATTRRPSRIQSLPVAA